MVREFYESYNDKDLDSTWGRYLAPGLVSHSGGVDYPSEAWLQIDKSLVSAFPDVHLEVLGQISEGDTVATRYVLGGFLQNSLRSRPPDHC